MLSCLNTYWNTPAHVFANALVNVLTRDGGLARTRTKQCPGARGHSSSFEPDSSTLHARLVLGAWNQVS